MSHRKNTTDDREMTMQTENTAHLSKGALELARKCDTDPEVREMLTDLLNYREATRGFPEAYITFKLEHGHNPSVEYKHRKLRNRRRVN